MVLNHGYHSMWHILLVITEACIQILLKSLSQFFKDDSTVCYLLTIQLHKRELPLFWPQLHLMVHILQKKNSIKILLQISGPIVSSSGHKSVRKWINTHQLIYLIYFYAQYNSAFYFAIIWVHIWIYVITVEVSQDKFKLLGRTCPKTLRQARQKGRRTMGWWK